VASCRHCHPSPVWLPETLTVTMPVRVSCGHLVPEHSASEVVQAILPFFKVATARGQGAVDPLGRN
jgi:hypothetical protein